MRNIVSITIVIGIVYLLFLWLKPDQWTGIYYPEGCLHCEESYVYSDPFRTSDECLAWARNQKYLRNDSEGLYECGLNCEVRESGILLCEETLD